MAFLGKLKITNTTYDSVKIRMLIGDKWLKYTIHPHQFVICNAWKTISSDLSYWERRRMIRVEKCFEEPKPLTEISRFELMEI